MGNTSCGLCGIRGLSEIMIGLEFVSAGLLHFAATSRRERAYEEAKQKAIAELTCDPKENLDIKIDPAQSPIKYDFTKTIDQIGQIGEGAYSPYGAEHQTFTMGLTVGRQQIEYNIRTFAEVYDELDRACVHIRNITVKMNYNPTVYVATEYPKGSCEFNAVLEHELEHVKITQKALNKYAKKLGKHLQESFRRGHSFGPFKGASTEKAKEMLIKKIEALTLKINNEMYAEDEKHQNRFDDHDKGKITAVCDKKG